MMSEDKYDNYTDDDFLADLNAYADQRDAEQAEDNDELKQHLGEMVGGFLGVWWYLRAFSAASSRNIRTYAAVADKQAKLTAWEMADEQIKQEHPHYQSKVIIMNEFGACKVCLPYLGNYYSMDEAKSLVPFHYNCRCTIRRITKDFDAAMAGAIVAEAQAKHKEQQEHDQPALDFISDIPDNILMSQNKHVLESNDYRPGKSYLAEDLYTKVPGTKNRYDYTKLQELFDKSKATLLYTPTFNLDGTVKTLQAVATFDRIVGYVINKDGTIQATNQLKVHYKKSSKMQNGYHFVPKINTEWGKEND